MWQVFASTRLKEPLSVRVSANYRITFGWSGEDAIAVNFEDYH